MSDAHTGRTHARLAPSAAHRWIACPGSVPYEETFPDTESDAAMEGTAAHELASHCLVNDLDAAHFAGRVIDVHGASAATRFLAADAPLDRGRYVVDDEMVACVQDYLDIVRYLADGGDLHVETRVRADRVHDEISGTADAIIYRPGMETLHVVDLKYGRGVVVEADGNPQLQLYASGALRLFHNRPVRRIRVHIFQPRAPHPDGRHRAWEFTLGDHEKAENALKAAAKRVDEATVNFVPGKPPTEAWAHNFLSAGEHCRFCKAMASCPAQRVRVQEMARKEFADPASMSPEDLAKVLKQARQLQHWIKAIEDHANAEAAAGRPPPGFKLVEGRKTRRWADEEQMKELLPVFCASLTVDDMYDPPKLKSPAGIEKLISTDEKKALATFVEAKASGTQLVEESDPRPPIRPTAADELGGISAG